MLVAVNATTSFALTWGIGGGERTVGSASVALGSSGKIALQDYAQVEITSGGDKAGFFIDVAPDWAGKTVTIKLGYGAYYGGSSNRVVKVLTYRSSFEGGSIPGSYYESEYSKLFTSTGVYTDTVSFSLSSGVRSIGVIVENYDQDAFVRIYWVDIGGYNVSFSSQTSAAYGSVAIAPPYNITQAYSLTQPDVVESLSTGEPLIFTAPQPPSTNLSSVPPASANLSSLVSSVPEYLRPLATYGLPLLPLLLVSHGYAGVAVAISAGLAWALYAAGASPLPVPVLQTLAALAVLAVAVATKKD